MTDLMKETLRKVQDLQRDADYNRIKRFEITCVGMYFVVDITNGADEHSSTIFDELDVKNCGSDFIQYHIDQIRVATRTQYTKDEILGMTVEEFIRVKNICLPDADFIIYDNNAENLAFVADGDLSSLVDMMHRGSYNTIDSYFIKLEEDSTVCSFCTVRDLFDNGILNINDILEIFNS